MLMPSCIKFFVSALLSHSYSILENHSAHNLSLEDNDQAFFSLS